MFTALLGKVLGLAGSKAVDYFNRKQELKQELSLAKLAGKVEVEKAQASYKVKQLNADKDWELASLENSGWKDEWVLLLLSIPLVMVFIPSLAPYVQQGFIILDTTPDWYRWLLVMIFAATYGIRVWRRKT